MTTFTTRCLILALALVAAAGVALADGELRFIQKGEMFDLSELADGERREFGAGEHRIVAERRGEIVTITRAEGVDGRQLDVTCDVSTDTCQVLTGTDDDHVMIRVEKRRVCAGEDCMLHDVDVHAIGGGVHNVSGEAPGEIEVIVGGEPGSAMRTMIINRTGCAPGEDCDTWVTAGDVHGEVVIERVECRDEGEGEACDTFVWSGEPGEAMPGGMHGKTMVFVDDSGEATVLGAGSQVLLRCPEGDAHIRVGRDEADDTFLCPKHSVAMERVRSPHVMPHGAQRRIRIERKGD